MSCQSPVPNEVSSTSPEEDAIASSTSSETSNDEDVSTTTAQNPATENPQITQNQNEQSVFEGEGLTVTITGSGASAAYRGCNGKQECLEIPQAANYARGTYTWENNGYTYVMAPAPVDSDLEPDGVAYQLRVYDPSRNTIVDAVMAPVATGNAEPIEGDVVLEPNILDEFYMQADTLDACADYFDLDVSKNSSTTYPINGDGAIVEILCFLSAYQGVYEYWLYQSTALGGEFIPLSFDTYMVDSGQHLLTQVHELGGLPTYDPAQETLTIFTKYRGLGDCGSYSEYQWQGTEFDLVTYRSKDECDGTALDPIEYPQIYP